jgi:hypothetical protein
MNRAARRNTPGGRGRRQELRRDTGEGGGIFSRPLLLIVGVLSVISLGVVGAIIAGGSGNEVSTPSLSSFTRLSELNVDQITIDKQDDHLTLNRQDAIWTVGSHAGNAYKIDYVWGLLNQIGQLQSISVESEQHSQFSLTPELGTTVSFWSDGAFVDSLIVGEFDEESGGTFMRHPSSDDIAGIGFDMAQFFSSDVDDWRNNVVFNGAAVLFESLKYTYPDEVFTVEKRLDNDETERLEAEEQDLLQQQAATNAAILTGQTIPEPQTADDRTGESPARFSWIIKAEESELTGDADKVMEVLQVLSPLFASEFADEEWERLSQDEPDWSLEIGGTGLGSLAFLSFYQRQSDDGYFVRKTGTQEVFVIDIETISAVMKRPNELQALLDIESGP